MVKADKRPPAPAASVSADHKHTPPSLPAPSYTDSPGVKSMPLNSRVPSTLKWLTARGSRNSLHIAAQHGKAGRDSSGLAQGGLRVGGAISTVGNIPRTEPSQS